MESKYKLIIFDLGNVILKFDHRISAGKISRYAQISQDEIYDTFFNSRLAYAFDKGSVEPRHFYKSLKNRLRLNDLSFKEFIPIWEDIFRPNWPVIRIARRLKKQYPLYMISNANKLHARYVLRKFSFFSIFDKIFLSYKLKMMKPHPNIYRLALKCAGVRPKEAIFIDDRKELLPAAARIGIKTVNFRDADRLVKQLKGLGVL